jgi:hypothetical protein
VYLPLVDSLRCIAGHEDTWLVASIEIAEERDIRHGFLGCPVCLAEYPIRDGVVYFGVPVAESNTPPLRAAADEDAIRLAAVLDLTDPRMVAMLHGTWGALAPLVRGFSSAQLLLVNPPMEIASGDGVSVIHTAAVAPLARGSVDAVAIDSAPSPEMLESLVGALREGGRLAGPSDLTLPPGITELTRNDRIWVAERTEGATSPLVSLRRAR